MIVVAVICFVIVASIWIPFMKKRWHELQLNNTKYTMTRAQFVKFILSGIVLGVVFLLVGIIFGGTYLWISCAIFFEIYLMTIVYYRCVSLKISKSISILLTLCSAVAVFDVIIVIGLIFYDNDRNKIADLESKISELTAKLDQNK